jgi:hypothetical protein
LEPFLNVKKVETRNIFLIGIREISNDLPIDELTVLFGNEILNDEKNTKIVTCC